MYEFPLDAAIRQYKFHRRLWYAPAFAELLLPAFDVLPETIDALLPVPLHWLRHGTRGFNQATEICRSLRRRVDLLRCWVAGELRVLPLDQEHRRAWDAAVGQTRAAHELLSDVAITALIEQGFLVWLPVTQV